VAVALRADPDWAGAARALVAGLEAQPTLDGRVEVIDRCREALGDQVYPAFLKLLAAVACFGDESVRRLTAETLAHGLATSRLPTTRIPAWGAGGGSASLAALGLPSGGWGGLGGSLPGSGRLLANLRSVGPIEYLCIWSQRDVAAERLDEAAFETALSWILTLVDASPDAARLYRAKLRADTDNPVEGLHDQTSRRLLAALVAAWDGGATAAEVARRTVEAGRADRQADRWTLPRR